MEIDQNLHLLPLTKSKASSLTSLFGNSTIDPYWVADMEFEIAKPIQKALVNRITDASFGYEYKPDSFFDAQNDWYQRRYGVELHQHHVIYSPSITTTLSVLIENFTAENNGIIIQPPVFMDFGDVIRNANRSIVKNPLKLSGNHYQIDIEDLAEKAKVENNKMLIICNPHNPVGRVWTKEELQHIVSICKENNLLLVSDEIHKDIILFGHPFTSALSFIADYKNIVVCTSEAKTFNLCGISDSMAIIPNETIRNSISTSFKKFNLGRTNALTRVALEAAYRHGEPWLDELIIAVQENIASIERELAQSRIQLIKPEGTYQVWLDFRNVYTDTKEMFHHLTAKSGIGLNAGHWFGREGALFMRMNIATSNDKVIAAIKRIKEAASSLD